MSQNLVMEQARCAKRPSVRLLPYVHLGFRFVRHQCLPWLVLAIAPLKWLFASGVERTHEQVRYFNAIARIDFVGVYGLLDDLLW